MTLFKIIDNKGLTVIELLVAIVILGVVMAIVTGMVVQSFNVFDSSTRRMSAGQLAELAKTEIAGYLRTTIPHTDNNFEDLGEWRFKGYHPRYPDLIVDFTIKHDEANNTLSVEINGGEIEGQSVLILNNVVDFDINQLDDDNDSFFEIYVKIDDGDNIATKRTTVKSRNFI